jgi:hypothetical protein
MSLIALSGLRSSADGSVDSFNGFPASGHVTITVCRAVGIVDNLDLLDNEVVGASGVVDWATGPF